jgi:hypothetical protein
MGSNENRALSIEMRQAAEEQNLHKIRQERRATNLATIRQRLMELDNHPMKRPADEASNSVAQQALELAHSAAKARRVREMQDKQNKLSMQEQARKEAAEQKAALDAAKQQLATHHRDRDASHHKRVAADRAALAAERKQIEAQRKSLERKKATPKRQAAPTRTQSMETVDYRPNRSESVETVNYRSRSRAKSANPVQLPIRGEETSVEPVKRPKGRPKKPQPEVAADVVKKPRGRPKSKP